LNECIIMLRGVKAVIWMNVYVTVCVCDLNPNCQVVASGWFESENLRPWLDSLLQSIAFGSYWCRWRGGGKGEVRDFSKVKKFKF
jgi:hypothetical protein